MKKLQIGALVLVGIALVIGALNWAGGWDLIDARDQGIDLGMYRAFAQVCVIANPKDLPERLQGIPVAAEFLGGAEPHPFVALSTAGGFYDSAQNVPREWKPTALAQVQLILCVTKERLDLPAPRFPLCAHLVDYLPGKRVGLYVARTGQRIWTSDFYRYYEPCAQETVDTTALSNMLKEIQTHLADGTIKP